MSVRVVRGACPHDCPDTCAMLVTVDASGRATRVRGDPDHATTQGFLCAKVNRYLDRTYSPDRILVPQIRTGAKGEGRFRPATWEEALDRIAQNLGPLIERRPEAVLPYSYSGTLGLVQNGSLDRRFFHAIGASLLDRTICSTCGSETLDAVLGRREGPDITDLPRAKTIIGWGTNTLTSNVHLWPFVRKARERGARFVVIDPVRTRTAERADAWIAPHPGTDGALALGLTHLLFKADRVDRDFLETQCTGSTAFESEADAWTPERTAQVTGIDVSVIRGLAADLGDDPRVAIRLNYGLQRHAGGGAAVRAILALASALGAWKHPGCGALLSTSGAFPVNRALGRPDLLPDPRPRTINMNRLGAALDPAATRPPVDALFVYASNPAAVAPDQNAVLDGLRRESLFCVVHELFMTDTARFADVLLPATSQLEQWDVHKSYGHLDIVLNQPSIAPLGEAVCNTELFRRLARRLGLTEPALFDEDAALIEQAFDWDHPRLEGISVDRLRSGPMRLRVPSPYLPFASPADDGRKIALDGLPGPWFVAPEEVGTAETAAGSDRLALISPPAHHFLNSSFANLPFARRDEPEPRLLMHPEDATARSLADADLVEVKNARGAFIARVSVTDGIRRGTVCAPSVWWLKHTPSHRNANAVTSQQLTDVGRGATFYDCAVRVEKTAVNGR